MSLKKVWQNLKISTKNENFEKKCIKENFDKKWKFRKKLELQQKTEKFDKKNENFDKKMKISTKNENFEKMIL